MTFSLLKNFLQTNMEERVEVLYRYLVQGESSTQIAENYYMNKNYSWKISAITQGYSEKGGVNRGRVSVTRDELDAFVYSNPDGTYKSGLTVGDFYSSLRIAMKDEVLFLFNEFEDDYVKEAVSIFHDRQYGEENAFKCALSFYNSYGIKSVLGIYQDQLIIYSNSRAGDIDVVNFEDILNFSLSHGFDPEIWLSSRRELKRNGRKKFKFEFRFHTKQNIETLFFELASLLEKWRRKNNNVS
ncbi:TPA: hypothetical protein U2D04_000204 [Streptococcus suis]|nr:hypothetical protein [Streptococcus suis]NQJ68714.1 hypothetical protein [Streptococcus suis]NQJ77051.1 hypothetical protein [Streptococcus suis]HEM6338642.1 hypothetical protein [Streptococcus suis]